MTDQERLWEIVRDECKSKAEFARKLGYKNGRTDGIDYVLEKGHSISDNLANRIVKNIPKWNFNYVRYGTGEPLNVKIDKGKESIDERLSRIKEESLSYESKPKPEGKEMITLTNHLIDMIERISKLEKEVELLKKAVGLLGEEANKNDLVG